MFGGVCQVFAEAPKTPKILFTSARDGNYEIYMMNPDGSEQVNLTQHPAIDLDAAWSPTGEQILFVSDRGGTRDLYLMDADGGNVRRVFKRKIEVWRTGLPGRPIANSLLTSAWTGTLSRAVSILGRLAKKMPNSSRITSCPGVVSRWFRNRQLCRSSRTGGSTNVYQRPHTGGGTTAPR